ncbi:hypothetical protein BKH28_10395 [Actinomyces oris]|uniref:Uncharacterized protein n=1 Tax=Actinomyces oris TaxID=544580 RepID=A0A1Q8VJX6_9ACTO|nr:hypothetical protein BKH28_10395 [Actinomyces oris]
MEVCTDHPQGQERPGQFIGWDDLTHFSDFFPIHNTLHKHPHSACIRLDIPVSRQSSYRCGIVP